MRLHYLHLCATQFMLYTVKSNPIDTNYPLRIVLQWPVRTSVLITNLLIQWTKINTMKQWPQILTRKVLVAAIDTLDTFKQDNYSTVGGDGGCRVGKVRAGTTSPIPDHNGFKLQ